MHGLVASHEMWNVFACSVIRRIAQYVADILEPEDKDKIYENLLVGQSKVRRPPC